MSELIHWDCFVGVKYVIAPTTFVSDFPSPQEEPCVAPSTEVGLTSGSGKRRA